MRCALVALSVLLWAHESQPVWARTPKKQASRLHGRSAHARSGPAKTRRNTRTFAVEAPRVQAEPTPDRYREIQSALAAKGYLKSSPSGQWDTETQEAMRRYQADNQFEATGRINSRSLIGLGLGGPAQDH